jgi:hypothetical protein
VIAWRRDDEGPELPARRPAAPDGSALAPSPSVPSSTSTKVAQVSPAHRHPSCARLPSLADGAGGAAFPAAPPDSAGGSPQRLGGRPHLSPAWAACACSSLLGSGPTDDLQRPSTNRLLARRLTSASSPPSSRNPCQIPSAGYRQARGALSSRPSYSSVRPAATGRLRAHRITLPRPPAEARQS